MPHGPVGQFDVQIDGDLANVVEQRGIGDGGGPSLRLRRLILGLAPMGSKWDCRASGCRRRFPGRGPACRRGMRDDAPRKPGRPGPARRSVPAAPGTRWRTACARATCAARCVPAASVGAASPAAKRPTQACSTLSGDRWRVLAMDRQRPRAVFAGTGEHVRCLMTGRPGGLLAFRGRAFPLHPIPLPFRPFGL